MMAGIATPNTAKEAGVGIMAKATTMIETEEMTTIVVAAAAITNRLS